MATNIRGEKWLTFEEVQSYLGHKNSNSTEVWLTRHNIKAVRFYRVKEVVTEREGR